MALKFSKQKIHASVFLKETKIIGKLKVRVKRRLLKDEFQVSHSRETREYKDLVKQTRVAENYRQFHHFID